LFDRIRPSTGVAVLFSTGFRRGRALRCYNSPPMDRYCLCGTAWVDIFMKIGVLEPQRTGFERFRAFLILFQGETATGDFIFP
jgi:hypothetical protein